VKTKPKGRVQVVQDDNDELTVGDDVFQLGELVDLYRVAPSNELQENSNFCIAENIFADVNVEELNDILNSGGYTQVDEDDSDEINVKDCDEDRTSQLTKKKTILINLHKMSV
jgi:hypothetical protein